MSKTLLVFHDAENFGGHELAFFEHLPYLLASPNISRIWFSFYEGNEALARALAGHAHDKLTLLPMPFESGRAAALTALVRLRYQSAVRRLFKSLKPDAVLLLQGRIEATTVPILALPRGADVVSYIPMAHSARELGYSGLKSTLLDLVKRPYYHRPARFIVPSQSVARQLDRTGAKGPKHVVPNMVADQPPGSRSYARTHLGVPAGKRVALFMARFDPHQKGIDLLIAAIERDKAALHDWFFLFVGRGPGEGAIRALFKRNPELNGGVHCWTDRPRDVLASCDVLLMPSRFEGVPLTMLEALASDIPVLGSGIDVFEEYLPSSSRWDFSTGAPLGQRLAAAQAGSGLAERVSAGSFALTKAELNQSFERALLNESKQPVHASEAQSVLALPR